MQGLQMAQLSQPQVGSTCKPYNCFGKAVKACLAVQQARQILPFVTDPFCGFPSMLNECRMCHIACGLQLEDAVLAAGCHTAVVCIVAAAAVAGRLLLIYSPSCIEAADSAGYPF